MTDFYYSWTGTERTWAGQHYDMAMSGSGPAWHAANPTATHSTYALLWTMVVARLASLATNYYLRHAELVRVAPAVFAREGLRAQARRIVDQSGRVYYYRLGGYRWAINPKDAGAIAYTVSRAQRIASADGGIFFDESSSGDMTSTLGDMEEFASRTDYVAAMANVIGQAKAAVGSKMIMLNTADVHHGARFHQRRAAPELCSSSMFNNFKWSGMYGHWRWVANLASAGVFVDVVSPTARSTSPGMTSSYPRGELAVHHAACQAVGARELLSLASGERREERRDSAGELLVAAVLHDLDEGAGGEHWPASHPYVGITRAAPIRSDSSM